MTFTNAEKSREAAIKRSLTEKQNKQRDHRLAVEVGKAKDYARQTKSEARFNADEDDAAQIIALIQTASDQTLNLVMENLEPQQLDKVAAYRARRDSRIAARKDSAEPLLPKKTPEEIESSIHNFRLRREKRLAKRAAMDVLLSNASGRDC